jgi:predicted double-glycine peptidase
MLTILQAFSASVPALCGMALAFLFLVPATHAGTVDFFGGEAFGNLKVKSLKEQQYRNTSRQMLDHSCGSAALSTLLTYHYRKPTSEVDIYQSMWEIGDQEKIRREGFSMLDMKAYLEKQGYSADGYETTLEKLGQFGVPGIVLIKDSGYNHFVVVKGVRDQQVSYGDPALGLRVVPIEEFRSKMINRIVFVINGKKDLAVFNHPNDWKIRELAPTHLARGNLDLSQHTLLLRPPGDY